MKIRFVQCFAIAFAMLVGSTAIAQDYYELDDTSVETVSYMGGGDDGKGCDKGCDDDCGKGGCCGGILDGLALSGGGAYVDLEALFFRASPATTAFFGPNQPQFNNEIAPRISVGYVGPGGLGVRFRYFDYSHDTGGITAIGDRSLLLDTYTIDAEFFESIQVGCNTSIEWSTGVRYNDFKYRDIIANTLVPPTAAPFFQEQFSGWGLTFGLQVDRCIGPGNIYAKARWSVLQDENSTNIVSFAPVPPVPAPVTTIDDIRMVTELALGYEVSRCTGLGVITGRIGYEMQFWEGYTSSFMVPTGSDALGLDGLVLGLELAR